MTAAIHLHLFYPDLARELARRVAALPDAPTVYATHHGPLDPELPRLLPAARFVEVPNRGWDLGPLLHILPLLEADGVDAVAHLHTKAGNSGYAAEWRALGWAGTLGALSGVTAALADPAVMLAGPAALYKSAAAHQFGNAELLSALAPALAAPLFPPCDWGFFAGSFFWARTALLRRLAPLAAWDDNDARDGTLAHALERLVGLAAVALDGRVALVGPEGAIEVVDAPGRPSHEPIVRTLVREAERQAGPPDPALAARIAAANPLADYVRCGRDADALDPNPYFSSTAYRRIHEDVLAADMHPLEHYLRHGWKEGRITGPLFDGRFYRTRHSDVSGDPLRHYLEVGAAEGRLAIPTSEDRAADDDGPRRFYREFDVAVETAFLRAMAAVPAPDDTLVSVIMPAWNRAESVGSAIRSVLAQGHERLELIVVDDGSTDGTPDAIRPFLADPRVRLVEGAHAGVSAARNLGLAHATGDVIAYLDSDNRWVGWFLQVMLRSMAADGVDAAYSAIALRDDLGQLVGYRGAPFDWDACLAQNYVDLNAFVHHRALLDGGGPAFDINLRRMVDWDMILRVTRGRAVGYAPFVGCDYSDRRNDPARITTGEASAYQKLVRLKHEAGLATGTPAFRDAVRLAFAIKIAAPEGERESWGDWHFADALAAAIRARGHDARVDCREAWGGHALADEDVAIVLRGLLPYTPRAGQMALLWLISHPDQVPFEEMDRFTRVYAAGESHAALLEHLLDRPVAPLLQATDPARFRPRPELAPGVPLAFVGNTRRAERPIVDWAVAAGLAPAIWGGGWEDRVPATLVRGAVLDNAAVAEVYATAGAVLNDHWPSMAAHGYLSNRLFDVAAAGGCAISDPVPAIRRTFGDAVAQVDGPRALAAAVAAPRPRDPALAAAVAAAHSFDARAARLVGDVEAALGLVPPIPAASRSGLRVHLLAPHGPHGPQSSAFIRILCPLTDESVAGRVALTLGRAADPLPDCDVCIVQRTALDTVADVDALVGALGVRGAVLVTDVDDAFSAMGDHPEASAYAGRARALQRAIAASAETWFSCAGVADAYAGTAHRTFVAPNALDPRLWRDWRHPRGAPGSDGPLHLLYMGTATHGADFDRIRPALDRLWADRPHAFDVTLVGVAAEVPPAPWLHRLSPPAEAVTYPRFVRWLRGQGPFHAGLAPLVDSAFNRAKSDIKLLDYAALGLLPVVEDAPAYRADAGFADMALFADDWHAKLCWVMDNRGRAAEQAMWAHERLWTARSVAQSAPALVARLEALVR